MTNRDRRHFLQIVGLAPLALLAGRAIAADAPACYDPAALPLSQKSRRRSLGYLDRSVDPAKHCSLCSFFTASQPGCGTCSLLNGPVTAESVCDSFAPKAK